MVSAQGDEPEALADELVSSVAIARARSHGKSALTVWRERWLGQQVTRQGIHVTSVDASRTLGRSRLHDCGQIGPGYARQAPIARLRMVRCCCSRAMSSPNIRL
jgi:hypothetical protein